jgi:hypothetical protein
VKKAGIEGSRRVQRWQKNHQNNHLSLHRRHETFNSWTTTTTGSSATTITTFAEQRRGHRSSIRAFHDNILARSREAETTSQRGERKEGKHLAVDVPKGKSRGDILGSTPDTSRFGQVATNHKHQIEKG